MVISRLRSLVRNLFRRDKAERDLEAEVRSYADLVTEEKVAQGMRAEDASRSARMELGGPEQLKEEVRAARSGAWIGTLWQDVRFGARLLRRNSAFTAVAVLTLALGIGANTAVFSVVNAVVLRPLPYKDSARLITVQTIMAMFPNLKLGNSSLAIDQMRQNASALEQVAAYQSANMNLTQTGDPARLSVIRVGEGFFDVMGAAPQEGRLLLASDMSQAHGRVVVLSDALWRNRFGADPGVINRTITLDNSSYTVVGVAPRGFTYPTGSSLWIPLVLTNEEQSNADSPNNQVVAKLRRGSSIAQVQTQLNVIARDIIKANPELKEGYDLRATTLLERRIGNMRTSYLLLFGAASFVLLIACANLASLLLARGWARQREMALRTALGATRGRIVRQSLVESCLHGLLGGVAGAVLASSGIEMLRQIAPSGIARLSEVEVDASLFWFALGSSLISGILFGIMPALRLSRLYPNSALKAASAGSVLGIGAGRQSRLSGGLVVSEVALAFILLIGAVATTEGLYRLLKTETGFRADHLLTLDVPLVRHTPENPDAARSMTNAIVSRIRPLPGINGVAVTDHPLLGGSITMITGFKLIGAPPLNSSSQLSAHVRSVSPDYFEMLGIGLVSGRFFTDHDTAGSEHVAIANEAIARQLWGTIDIVGKRLSISNNGEKPVEWVVAGVVRNSREVDLGMEPQPELYFPYLQGRGRSLHLIIRTAQDPGSLAHVVSQQIWALDKDQPVTSVATMDQLIHAQVGEPRFQTVLLIVFGLIGLLLALLGVYGVVSYSVARRTREIGIRMALGASRTNVLRMVIRQGLVLAVIGVALGAGGAAALSRVLASNLAAIKATSAPTYILVGLLVVIVACLACYVPARRAMRVDPIVALRYE